MSDTQPTPAPESPSQPAVRLPKWIADIARPHPSIQDIATRRQVQLLLLLSAVVGLLNVIGAFSGLAVTGWAQGTIISFAITAVFILVYILGRSKAYALGLAILPISLIAFSLAGRQMGAVSDVSASFFVALGLILASILLHPTWLLVLTLSAAVAAPLMLSIAPHVAVDPRLMATEAGYDLTIGLALYAVTYFRNRIETDRLSEVREINRELDVLRNALEMRVAERTASLERRTRELQIAARVARDSASLQKDLADLLSDVTELISTNFGFYHTGIFLLDERGEYAILAAASSEGGQRMLERNHQLKVGSQGVVGTAASRRRPYVALDVGSDAVFFNNPDLPDTHSEIALPLIARGQVIGVLDVQSVEAGAFGQEEIEVMQALADQVAVAIDNSRLQSETREALEQLEQLISERARESWSQRRAGENAFTYTPAGVTPAGRKRSRASGRGTLEIPVMLRGQTIGSINLMRKDGKWDEREQELAAEIAAQAGLALENARLLQESQSLAARERLLADATGKVWSATTIEAILELAARELGSSLGASEITIDLEGSER